MTYNERTRHSKEDESRLVQGLIGNNNSMLQVKQRNMSMANGKIKSI